MDFAEVLRVLRRGWLAIAAFLLVGLTAAGVATFLQTPDYSSTSTALVSIDSAASASDLSQGNSYTQQIVSTYATVATKSLVLDPVIVKLHLPTNAEQLATRVTATAPLDQVLIEITATDHNAKSAADIANAVTAELRTRVAELAPTSSRNATGIRIMQVQVAKPALVASSPKPWINLLAGGFVGLALGIAVVLLRRSLNTRIHDAADLEAVAQRPVLGTITADPGAKAQPLTIGAESTGRRAEEFRSLRTNLQFVHLASGKRTIVVTSSIESEGKSSTSGNLAVALANLGQRVLIVDADLRRPRVADYFGIDGAVGLTDVLIGAASLRDAIQDWNGVVSVLPAGQVPPNPNELLQSAPMAELVERLSGEYDTVIFDSPPLVPVSDAAVLARQTGGALVLASENRVHQSQLKAALAQLDAVKAPVLGVVLTMAKRPRSSSYNYSRSYDSNPRERASKLRSKSPAVPVEEQEPAEHALRP
jgi:capsular exopolysaccharide synthesis family protein